MTTVTSAGRHGRRLVALAVAVLCLTGCDVTISSGSDSGAGKGPHLPAPPPVAESRDQLAELTVARPRSMRGYSRDRFPHWSQRGDQCTTRELVLKRDGVDVTAGTDCYPRTGRWYSAYDRRWIEKPSAVDIDHMVPLANAWRSGAADWSPGRREDFANDLSRGQLIAVSAASNRAKGDQDPSQWRPSNTGWWCEYARHWINVKYDYRLTVTVSEQAALEDMLDTC